MFDQQRSVFGIPITQILDHFFSPKSLTQKNQKINITYVKRVNRYAQCPILSILSGRLVL